MRRLDVDEDYSELDDMDSPPTPWGRAIGIACVLWVGLIVVYMIVNN